MDNLEEKILNLKMNDPDDSANSFLIEEIAKMQIKIEELTTELEFANDKISDHETRFEKGDWWE